MTKTKTKKKKRLPKVTIAQYMNWDASVVGNSSEKKYHDLYKAGSALSEAHVYKLTSQLTNFQIAAWHKRQQSKEKRNRFMRKGSVIELEPSNLSRPQAPPPPPPPKIN